MACCYLVKKIYNIPNKLRSTGVACLLQTSNSATASNCLQAMLNTMNGAQCCHCNSQNIVQDYLQSFGVAVCGQCRRYERTISKTNAKSTYLLSDADLSKLGYIEKQNPRHKEFSSMKMLLVSQVEEVAISKYGSLAAVQEEQQRRVRDKIDSRARKRAEAEAKQQRAQRVAQHVQEAVQEHATQLLTKHVQQEEDFLDPDTGKRKRRYAPEFAEVEVEEF